MELAARTSDLSTRIDSRLAVLVRLERSRLANLLGSRSVLSPDFAAIAEECKAGIARLASRVELLEQMDLILGRLAKELALGIPPTQVHEINASLQEAYVVLAKSDVSDVEIQTARDAVAVASSQVSRLGQPNADFGRTLATKIHDLLEDIDRTLAASATYQHLLVAVPTPIALLRAVRPDIQVIDPDRYVELDNALQKVTVMCKYVLLVDGTSNAGMQSRLQEHAERLIAYLQTQSWEGLKYARLLLREMKDDVYPERLLQLLTVPSEAFIEMDPPVAYERAPLEFAVRFRNPVFDAAAARDELSVEWDFGDELTNKGWAVSHYFQFRKQRYLQFRETNDTYDVQARVYYSNGDMTTDAHHDPIALSPLTVKLIQSEIGGKVGERTRAEALKLSAALLIAVFGLMSGAKDQISKLDILPGLVAVFLVGFSADSIKRLLASGSDR